MVDARCLASCSPSAMCPNCTCSCCRRWRGASSISSPSTRRRRIMDDAAYLARFSTPLARAAPSLALAFEEALRRLESARDEEPAAVASHGSFRSDQLLIEGDEPLMIDLDGLCWANPARDVGNFLAYLRWKAMREPHR